MPPVSCLQAIQAKYTTLTAAERLTADLILQDPEAVPKLSIAQFSMRSGAAQSAVVRCCKSLGYEGYADLKLALASEVARNRQLGFAPFLVPEDDPGDILDKVFAANVKTLHDTAEHLDRTALLEMVDRLEGAKHVFLYGVGTSTLPVKEFAWRLTELGKPVSAFTDLVEMKISTMNAGPGDFAVGISHSGRTVATIQALELAGKAGAGTGCLTSFPGSPITEVCELPLTICSDEIRYPMEAVSSRIAHLSLIDAIIMALSSRRYEEAAARARRVRELTDTIRYEEKRRS